MYEGHLAERMAADYALFMGFRLGCMYLTGTVDVR